MHDDDSREKLRLVYQKEDTGEKMYIPAKPKVNPSEKDRFFSACAYCRVSTSADEQLSSYELQQAHYRKVAEDHPNWNIKKIYADEGISGTSLKNRNAFNEMIEECMKGSYDLIVTKSVSRFARNLVDCVTLVRMLKGLNPPVGVFFETDNLFTLDEKSEFILSFLATLAQEESVKKREAMEWSLKERFKAGKLLTPALLGYDRPKDVTGRYIPYAPLEINEKEAEIVRFIYDAFLAGWSYEEIATFLTDVGCSTKTGSTKWTEGGIRYILSNERYCGEVLTWKTFTADLFEHKHRKNRQDRDQYLYKEHHEAIISQEKFEAVHVLMENRKHHMQGGLPALHVIDDGIFLGFIPINHHWVNDDPDVYYDISNSVNRPVKQKQYRKSAFSFFDLEGYQVVRNQFTQIRYAGPVIAISGERISFNTFCMRRFVSVGYIQLLLHPAERKMAIRPCNEKDAHSIRWRPDPEKKIYSKTISTPHFGIALYSIMNWNPDYLYKIRGVWAKRKEEQIIVFNLANAVPTVLIEKEEGDAAEKKRVELLPEGWGDEFGEGFYEHVLENDFYYLAPDSSWRSEQESIPAPGISQNSGTTNEELIRSMERLQARGLAND